MDDKVKEYAKRKIMQIELIQKGLDKLRKLRKYDFEKDEILNSLTRMDLTLSLGTAINLLQELKGVYENILKGRDTNGRLQG